jgi:cell division protein ZipA
MNELRWILIGFGIVLLAGIYLWGRRGSAVASDDAVVRVRPEPSHPPREPTVAGHETLPADEEEEISPPTPAAGRMDEYAITAVRAVTPRTAPSRTSATEAPASAGAVARSSAYDDVRPGRMEPTLGDSPIRAIDMMETAELPVEAESTGTAPTLSSSESPPVRRIERRKILALRLAATPHKFDGAKLQETLQAESLEHGKYNVFHRLHPDGITLFSVASMVEPGTFDLEKMAETQYPGVTLFAQLPGPVPGMHALNELVACARRLQQSLGGVLQDDRGVPLTVHRIERLRQEVREFERPPAGASGSRGSPAAPTVSS